jgi:anion-transporting  ArsA/GET3 family ATPase
MGSMDMASDDEESEDDMDLEAIIRELEAQLGDEEGSEEGSEEENPYAANENLADGSEAGTDKGETPKVVVTNEEEETDKEDDKVIAVHADDPQFKHITELSEVNPHTLKEIEQFFRSYKALEKKVVEVGAWLQRAEAEKVVEKACDFYKANLNKLVGK